MNTRRWIVSGSLGFLLLDQAVKGWVQQVLPQGEPVPVIPGIFQWRLTYNTGAAFSLFQQHPAVLLGIAVVILLVLGIYCFTRTRICPRDVLGYSLVMGGALGNLADRIRIGRVVDFIDVVAIHYPVFNVADICIFCGVVLLLAGQLRPEKGRADA